MIPKKSIEAYLARKRFNYSFYKDLTDDELEARKCALPCRPPIWSKLRREQKVCFLLGAKYRRWAMHVDTGVGKTLISIALIRYFAALGEANCVLVMVPNKVNKAEWSDEIKKHSPDTPFLLLDGSSAHKWEQLLDTKALIVIDTYAGLFRMVCDLVPTRKRKGKQRNKLVLAPDKVGTLCKLIDGLVLDESNAVANKGTFSFRIARQLIKTACMAIELSGTPFGRDPSALWAQMFLIDDGWSLGENLSLFRAAFFTEKKNYWGGSDYTFRASKAPLLNRFIAHRSIRYEADESTLPQLVSITKEVTLPGDARTYYDKFKTSIIKARGNFTEMKNAFVRMRQISSGFVGFLDDESGARAELEFADNPKLDLLISLLHEIRPDRKVLVFHDFIHSGQVIADELTAEGISHVRLHSKDPDPAGVLNRFKTDPDCRCFVLGTAGAYGLNLQVAQYGIFYESPVPVILRKQMVRRYERQGSEHKKVFLYDLVMRDTVDRLILAFHRQGKSLFDAIIGGEVKL
jgi:SNF2 family DNA or RNA helicase